MAVDVRSELITDLRGHERMCDAFGIEVPTKFRQVETQVFGDDIHGCTTGESGIEIHHTSIETERSIRCYFVSGMQVIVTLIPMTKGNEVTMLELNAFGDAGGTGGIKQYE